MTISARHKPDSLLSKAVSFHKAGDLDRAQSAYEKVLEFDPAHTGAMTLLGTLYLQRGKVSEGLELINKSLARNPYQPLAFNSRANALKDMHRYSEALADYDRAIGLDSRFADAWSNKGMILSELNRHEEALACFDKA